MGKMHSEILLTVVILILSVVIHEVAHGWVAYRLGDPTAKLQGRLTLNPIPHLDLVGSIILPGILVLSGSPVLFGWAKPVPYNPYNLQGRFAELKVALAGPVSNLLLAGIAGLVIRFGSLSTELIGLLVYVVLINCVLAVFNLIPIPPLDGSKILFDLLPSKYYEFREFLERYQLILIMGVLFIGWQFIAPLAYLLTELFIGQNLF